jgi:hypothetical protein
MHSLNCLTLSAAAQCVEFLSFSYTLTLSLLAEGEVEIAG